MMRDRQGPAIGEARTAAAPAIGGRHHVRGLVVATAGAMLMAFVGAFGTTALPFLPRLAYWLILMETGAAIGIGVSTGVRAWGRLAARPIVEGMAISLLIALPLTLVAIGATLLFFDLRAPDAVTLATMFLAVLVMTGAITAINYATGRPGRTGEAAPPLPAAYPTPAETAQPPLPSPPPPDMAAPPRPRLLDRLPPHLRAADIAALESEDHYLRVHAGGTSHLILLRMADAVAELEGIEGARTHRSWWVARRAVVTAAKIDGRGELTLVDGTVVPVSRSATPALHAAGWFDRSA